MRFERIAHEIQLFTFKWIWEIVWCTSLVVVEGHWTISLIVLNWHSVWAVNWQLQVVWSQTVTVCVSVREQATLQHLVRRGFDSRNKMTWSKCELLNLCEIVVGISVQGHSTDRNQREFLLRPDFSDIEWVELDSLGFLESHDLDEAVPWREITLDDGVVQITDRIIGIRASKIVGLAGWQVLNTLSCLKVELAVMSFAIVVNQLEGMRAVANQANKYVQKIDQLDIRITWTWKLTRSWNGNHREFHDRQTRTSLGELSLRERNKWS